MGSIRLLGRDHTEYGQARIEELDNAAIGITRGRHPKAYPYVDPNEDAALLWKKDHWTLMVVADGHHGLGPSHAAVEAIHDAVDRAKLTDHARDTKTLFDVGQAAIVSQAPPADPEQAVPGTTLVVVVAASDGGTVAWVGDSVAARIRGGRGRDLTPFDPRFINPAEPQEPRVGSFRLRPGDLVVTVTDGFTNFVTNNWVDGLTALAEKTEPGLFIQRAFDSAGDNGGGDNVAMTVAIAS